MFTTSTSLVVLVMAAATHGFDLTRTKTTIDSSLIDFTKLNGDLKLLINDLDGVDTLIADGTELDSALTSIRDMTDNLETRFTKENLTKTAMAAPCGILANDCDTAGISPLIAKAALHYGRLASSRIDALGKFLQKGKVWPSLETIIHGMSNGYHEGQQRCCIRKSDGCECMSDAEGGCKSCYAEKGEGVEVETLEGRRRSEMKTAVIEFGRPRFTTERHGNVTFTAVHTPGCSLDGEPGEPGLPIYRRTLLGLCGYKVENVAAQMASGQLAEIDGPLLPYQFDAVDAIITDRGSRLWYDDANFEARPSGLHYNITRYAEVLKQQRPVCTTMPLARSTPQCGVVLECRSGTYTDGIIRLYQKLKVQLVPGDAADAGDERRHGREILENTFLRSAVQSPRLPRPGPLVDDGEFTVVTRAAMAPSAMNYYDARDAVRQPYFNDWFIGYTPCSTQQIGRTLTSRLRFLFESFGLNSKLPHPQLLKGGRLTPVTISGASDLQVKPLWTAQPRPDLECTICFGADMLIVTTEALEAPAQELATFKRTRGMSVDVAVMPAATVSSGDLDAMRGWVDLVIEARYHYCDTRLEYVILFADSDAIPAWTLESSDSSLLGTDYFYGLVGIVTDEHSTFRTMQSDGDLPLWPEIQVGRMSADTAEEGFRIVNTTKLFETRPAKAGSPYYDNALLAAYFELDAARSAATAPLAFDDRGYIRSTERVKDIMTSNSKTSQRIYVQTRNTTRFTPQWHDDGSLVSADIQAIMTERTTDDAANKVLYGDGLAEGRFAFFHRDHGSRNGLSAPQFQISDLPSVVDPDSPPTVMFNLNCQSGRYDNENGHGCSGCGDSFAEEAMVTPGGPAAVIAGSRNTGTSANNALIETLGTSIFLGSSLSGKRSYLELGWLMNTAKFLLINSGLSDNSIADQKARYNLFGDPSMKMWIKSPVFWYPSLITNFELVPGLVTSWTDGITKSASSYLVNAVELKVSHQSMKGVDDDMVKTMLERSEVTASMPQGKGTSGMCGKRRPTVMRKWIAGRSRHKGLWAADDARTAGSMVLRTPDFTSEAAQAEYLRDLQLTLTLPGGERVAIDRIVHSRNTTLKCCAAADDRKLCDATCSAQASPAAKDKQPAFFKENKVLKVGNREFKSLKPLMGRLTGVMFETVKGQESNEEEGGEEEGPKEVEIECTVEAYEKCNDDDGVVLIRGQECSCVTFPEKEPGSGSGGEEIISPLGDRRRQQALEFEELKTTFKLLPGTERQALLKDMQDFARINRLGIMDAQCSKDECAASGNCDEATVSLADTAIELETMLDNIMLGSVAASAAADDDDDDATQGSSGSSSAALIAGVIAAVAVLMVIVGVVYHRQRKQAASLENNPEFEPFEHRTSEVAVDIP